MLKRKGHLVKLVFTGFETDQISGESCQIGVRLKSGIDCDVIGLGYVSNHQMDCLIQNAAVVVNPSLYEAGNGPGLDAWGRATPVAMSKIPAFIEHIESLGVKAELFEPQNPNDIALKLLAILENPDQAKSDAQVSSIAIKNKTWESTAKAYYEVFLEMIHQKNR